MDKTLKFLPFILWLIHSFLLIWIHLGFPTVIAKRIRQRRITSYEVVRLYIDRIRSLQSYLNVYIDERFDRTLIEA
ncbi:unnamed protein product [Adineta steineri]|uniref:Uncharacterized protein n=1 Tax=Adineta steineri TaxID=433720 RepID=A0A818LZC2_9BILA|nr:unnamed protein product [Adineta steineri]